MNTKKIIDRCYKECIHHAGLPSAYKQGMLSFKKMLEQEIEKNNRAYMNKKAIDIFYWLLGYTSFPERQEGQGQYYWRSILSEKLKAIGIDFSKKK